MITQFISIYIAYINTILHYINNLKIIRAATPGIPNTPAIKAVIQFIVIEKSKLAPTKFTIYNRKTPNIPFNNIFNGHLNNLRIIKRITNPIIP